MRNGEFFRGIGFNLKECYAESGRFGAHFSKNLGERRMRTWSEWVFGRRSWMFS